MSNLDILEYRIDRLEKNDEEQKQIVSRICNKLDKYILDETVKNQERDNKIKNLVFGATLIMGLMYNIGIDYIKKKVGM